MKQVTKALTHGKVTVWVCEADNATLGVVSHNVLHLTRLPESFCGKRGFEASDYRKVVKKAKAKFGVAEVVERPDMIITYKDGALEEYSFHNGVVSNLTEPEIIY